MKQTPIEEIAHYAKQFSKIYHNDDVNVYKIEHLTYVFGEVEEDYYKIYTGDNFNEGAAQLANLEHGYIFAVEGKIYRNIKHFEELNSILKKATV